MTTYHEEFPIPNEESIKSRFSNYLTYSDLDTTYVLSETEIDWLNTNVAPEVSEILGYHVDVVFGMVHFIPLDKTTVLHIDGNQVPRPDDDPNWALNIALNHYDQGQMVWYSGEYAPFIQSTLKGLTWIGIDTEANFGIIDSKILNLPTLVRIDEPHNHIPTTDNPTSGTKIILTIRFTPDIRPKDY